MIEREAGAADRVVCVVHSRWSDTGRVGRVLREKGFVEERCCVREGDCLPESLDDVAGVVVFGGPMSANDDDKLDFIARELRWIDRVLASGTPFLGICLGAQMLARCLGAQVRPHDEGWHEIGYTEVVPTKAGRSFMDSALHFYQWHGEGFDLPAGCRLLAGSARDHFPNQMFGAAGNVLGVQFHPECTLDIIRLWMSEASDRLAEPGAQQPEEQLAGARAHDHLIEHWVPGFIDRWLGRQDDPAEMIAA